jgi:hypothetical protein
MSKQKNGLKKFYVSMCVDGRVTIEVMAKDADDAHDKALGKWECDDFDFNKCLDIVDSHPVNCEDAEGNLTDYAY